MTSTQKVVVSAVIGLLALVGIVTVFKNVAAPLGSVNIANEYHATTTTSAWAGTAHTVVSNTSGTLGSVIIGTTHASVITIYDATSTTDTASTTLSVIAASPANGSTLTFDAIFTRGLIVSVPSGFAGNYTVTYR